MEGPLVHASAPRPPSPHAPIAFFDRDGVLNMGLEGHLNHPDEVQTVPGAASAIRRLRDEGMAVCVVTNQSGVGRGWTRPEDLHEVNDRLLDLLQREDQGAIVDLILACPHEPWAGCPCRKPAPGLLHLGANLIRETGWSQPLRGPLAVVQAPVATHPLDLMVGDRRTDVLAGHAFGCRSFFAPRDQGPADLMTRLLDPNDGGDALR